jgi:hypothetical protein
MAALVARVAGLVTSIIAVYLVLQAGRDRSSSREATVSTQGEAFADFVVAELKAERERRSTLDARATGVVTTSGTLTALIFAFSAFASTRPGYEASVPALVALMAALVSYVAAASFAVVGSRLLEYDVAEAEDLRQLTAWSSWKEAGDSSGWQITRANINTIETLRTGNNTKAWWVSRALACQVAAILLLAITVGLVVGGAL